MQAAWSTPGIVPIYGLGTYADGRPFYAMWFIKGDSLKEAADRFHAEPGDPGRPRPAGGKSYPALRRFTDVCDAIGYAHSRGVLHRDIKPGNIIVGRYGETLVVDWGLAKATGRTEPGSDSGERTLIPSSTRRVGGNAARAARHGDSGVRRPRTGGAGQRTPWAADGCLQPGRHSLLSPRRPAAARGGHRRSAPRRAAGRIPAAAAAQTGDRSGAGCGLPQGDGAPAGGSPCFAEGTVGGHRAVDGRRAGLGMARAAVPPLPPLG